MFWNFQAWHIIVNIKHSEQGHKMYCEGTDILCQDFSRDLTLCYDNAKRWRMPVTHGLLLSCTVGISLAICFCICIFLLLFKYNGILGLYQDEFFSWLSINELCFSFYFLLGLTHARWGDHWVASQALCYQILFQHHLTLHILLSNMVSVCYKMEGNLHSVSLILYSLSRFPWELLAVGNV